jgi:hypothetical protein
MNASGDDNDDNDDKVIIIMIFIRVLEYIPDYRDSSPPLSNLVDSSDVESNTGNIDSI